MLRLPCAPLVLASLIVSCAHAPSSSAPSAGPGSAAAFTPENPFARVSTLPYRAPRFDKITSADYQPALEEGMRQHLTEIDAIAEQSAGPTSRTRLSRWSVLARSSTGPRACSEPWCRPTPMTHFSEFKPRRPPSRPPTAMPFT